MEHLSTSLCKSHPRSLHRSTFRFLVRYRTEFEKSRFQRQEGAVRVGTGKKNGAKLMRGQLIIGHLLPFLGVGPSLSLFALTLTLLFLLLFPLFFLHLPLSLSFSWDIICTDSKQNRRSSWGFPAFLRLYLRAMLWSQFSCGVSYGGKIWRRPSNDHIMFVPRVLLIALRFLSPRMRVSLFLSSSLPFSREGEGER